MIFEIFLLRDKLNIHLPQVACVLSCSRLFAPVSMSVVADLIMCIMCVSCLMKKPDLTCLSC